MSAIDTYDSREYKLFTCKSEFDKSINILMGILHGISADNISISEIKELEHWLQFSRPFARKRPFDELIPLVNRALEDDRLDQDEIDDILWVCNQFHNTSPYYEMVTADLQKLTGYIHGILADNSLSVQEILALRDWLNENESLIGRFPYDEIYSLVLTILKDGHVDTEEKDYLKAFLSQFVDTQKSLNLNEIELAKLKKELSVSGICAMAPEIFFENKKFCFTGESTRTTRRELSKLVFDLNGVFSNTVTKDTSYLIVGNAGNDCWAFSCYGRKVEQAVKLRKEGIPVTIVNENDFWDAVEDASAGI